MPGGDPAEAGPQKKNGYPIGVAVKEARQPNCHGQAIVVAALLPGVILYLFLERLVQCVRS